jgi:putative membrane protein
VSPVGSATAGRRSRSIAAAAAPTTLAAGTIGAQILYPLLDGPALHVLTIVTVTLFFAASVSHAALRRGPRWAATMVLIAGGTGLAAEAVGVATGYPFGTYRYADSLGAQLFGVPLIVAMAWVMMAYPALLVAQRLTRRSAALVGAWALASWDVFLDPQMVAEGHWTWAHPEPALPGVPGIPLTNFAGWLVVSAVVMALLDRLPRAPAGTDDRAPAALFLWTYIGSVIGNIVFFGRPWVGLVGGVLMGLVAVPFAVRLWSTHR